MMGKHLRSRRTAISPIAVSFPSPVHPILPGEAGRPRRGDNDNDDNDDNDTMACLMGPVPSIAARGFR